MDSRSADPGRVLVVAGAAILIATMLVFLAFEPSGIVFAGPISLVAAAIAALCWFRGPRWRFLAGLAGLLLLLVSLSDASGLLLVESALDMMSAWGALLVGLLFLLSAATAVKAFSLPARSLATGAAGLMVVIGVGSGIVTLTGRNTLSAAELEGAVVIRANDTKFTPSDIPIPASGMLRLALINEDPFRHTFTSDALGVDEEMLPGRERIIEVEVPADTTEVAFFCRPHSGGSGDSRDGMVGVLQVE